MAEKKVLNWNENKDVLEAKNTFERFNRVMLEWSS
jgi:hypothetical protein